MNISASYWWEVIKVKLRGKLWIKPGRGQGYKEFFFPSQEGQKTSTIEREKECCAWHSSFGEGRGDGAFGI